jgi:hypothetical protein
MLKHPDVNDRAVGTLLSLSLYIITKKGVSKLLSRILSILIKILEAASNISLFVVAVNDGSRDQWLSILRLRKLKRDTYGSTKFSTH